MSARMKRRTFITMLGGAAAWPLAPAHAQQSLPAIGFLGVRTAEFDAGMLAEFRRGLREAGYVEGANVTIEFRWAAGEFDRLPGLARGSRSPARCTSRHEWRYGFGARREGGHAAIPIVFAIGDDPVTVRARRQPQPAGGEHHRCHQFLRGARGETARAAARAGAQGRRDRRPREPRRTGGGDPGHTRGEQRLREIAQQLLVLRARTEHEIELGVCDDRSTPGRRPPSRCQSVFCNPSE